MKRSPQEREAFSWWIFQRRRIWGSRVFSWMLDGRVLNPNLSFEGWSYVPVLLTDLPAFIRSRLYDDDAPPSWSARPS